MISTLKPRLLLSAAFVTLVALSTPASADVVFSNFGPGNTHSLVGLAISGIPTLEYEFGMGFTPANNFNLTQIEVGILHFSRANSVMLSLDQASGGLPGGTIESWTLTNMSSINSCFHPPGTCNTVQTVTPVSPASLVSGTEYWLVASPIGETLNTWGANITGSTAPVARNTGSGWIPETPGAFIVPGSSIPEMPGAFEVLGSVIPEPSPLGGGPSPPGGGPSPPGGGPSPPDGPSPSGGGPSPPDGPSPPGSAIPEPSTWAMMALGFAGLGFLGYRQTRRAKLQAA